MENSRPTCLVNGLPSDCVPLADRGLAYGDGVFETVLMVNGHGVLWDDHIKRLKLGVNKLGLPYVIQDSLRTRIAGFVNAFCNQFSEAGRKSSDVDSENASGRCIVKIIVTRGSGGRGYSPLGCVQANEILACFPTPDIDPLIYKCGIDVRILDATTTSNVRLSGIKHLNRLDQVLASAELSSNEFEGLMCDVNGKLVEGTRSNIIFKMNGAWRTPALACSGVHGVLRSYLLDSFNKHGLSIIEKDIDRSECPSIEAMAMVNSVFGVVPVSKIDNQELDISCVIEEIQKPVHQEIPFWLD